MLNSVAFNVDDDLSAEQRVYNKFKQLSYAEQCAFMDRVNTNVDTEIKI